MYIVTNPKGEVSPVPLESWNLRVLASGLQWNNRLRPDHIDDIDLVLAISILQQNGYDVQPAR